MRWRRDTFAYTDRRDTIAIAKLSGDDNGVIESNGYDR